MNTDLNKSSAVAEMSDRLATIDMGRNVEGAVEPLSVVGVLGPHLTQCRLGQSLPPCQVASWFIQLFGHNTPTLKIDRTYMVNGPVA